LQNKIHCIISAIPWTKVCCSSTDSGRHTSRIGSSIGVLTAHYGDRVNDWRLWRPGWVGAKQLEHGEDAAIGVAVQGAEWEGCTTVCFLQTKWSQIQKQSVLGWIEIFICLPWKKSLQYMNFSWLLYFAKRIQAENANFPVLLYIVFP
jgi:hypothetical protein